MASVLSIDGNLRSLYDQPTSEAVRAANPVRSTGYDEVAIGKPLVCRYLYRLIRIDRGDRNQILVSTYAKTREEKAPVAEAITFFDDNAGAKFQGGLLRLEDFGGKNYGHELCYYTKSYRGESIRLTSTVHELGNNSVAKAIAGAVGKGAALPMFSPLLPYAAGVAIGANLFQKLIDVFNRDDTISVHDVDLHFGRVNSKRLQSGRIVCIPGVDDAEFLPKEEGGALIKPAFRLSRSNRLVRVGGPHDGAEYTDRDYFVIQIDAKKHELYDKFDHYKGAAEIIARTNRSSGVATDILDVTSQLFGAAQDVYAIRRIEDLALEADDPETAALIKAELKSMSPDLQRMYQDRVKEILGS